MATNAAHIGFKLVEASVRKFPRYSRILPQMSAIFLVSTKNMWQACFEPVMKVKLRHINQFFGDCFFFYDLIQADILTMEWKGLSKRMKNPRTPEMTNTAIFQFFRYVPSQIFKSCYLGGPRNELLP